MISRITDRYIAAATEPFDGPITAYEDWLDNNAALANLTTVTPTLMRKLRTELKLSAVPQALRFFSLADQIHHMSLGAPVEDVSQDFRMAARFLSQAVLRSKLGDVQGAELANAITDCAVDNMPNLRRIGAGATGQLFTRVGMSIALVIEKMARALGLGAGYQVKTVDGVRWPVVRMMSKHSACDPSVHQGICHSVCAGLRGC